MPTRTTVDDNHYTMAVNGHPCKLNRVTRIINKVTGESKGGMSYWGAKLAIRWSAEVFEDVFDEMYTAFKASPYDPNKTKKARGKEGTAAHKVFEHLLSGTSWAEVDINGDVWIEDEDSPAWLAEKYDLGVARAFLDVFSHLDREEVRSEIRLRWFAEGHPDECPDDICTHGYAGTADFVIPVLNVLGDLKTHTGPARFPDMLQTAFYTRAYHQMYPDDLIDHHLILLAREDGTYEDFHGFVSEKAVEHALGLYEEMEGPWLA